MTQFTRRSALTLLTATSLCLPISLARAREAGGRKTIFIMLRGGLDGLATLIPADREMLDLRRTTLPDPSERLRLNSGFSLHPALKNLHQLYRLGELGFVHAAATSYRQRSHFEAQDHLELLGPAGEREGWFNRTIQAAGGAGLAVGYAVPLALQGAGAVTNWSPQIFSTASDDLLDRLEKLYETQPVLADPLRRARSMGDVSMSATGTRRDQKKTDGFVGKSLGEMMRGPEGPNMGMLSINGWDTHAQQAGRLAVRLAELDETVAALKQALGPEWAKTCVVICSEFGRTARENGTRGTDHGTGGLIILSGGAVRGGRIYGDWPGLKSSALHEGRDLAPANDVAAVLKGLLRDHIGLSRTQLDRQIFPGTPAAMEGLIRS